MAWTTPRTYVAGELMTAAIGNTHWRDNLALLKTSISDDGLEWTGKAGADFLPDADATRALGADATRFTDLYLSDQIYERDRATPLGEWLTPTFAAGDFTGRVSMTWTVDSGDVLNRAYTLFGKTMRFQAWVDASTVGGTLSTGLRIAIPAGLVAAKYMIGFAQLIDNGADLLGFCFVTPGATVIEARREDKAAFSASTNNTSVYVEIEFEVQ